ncbi:hypothetical protein M413DRAFT_439046 [Hebeloma cylindrosporum]|uniref:BTB domain-containing protein n=1 Tax=Hebeloma cylindrosporum TaxID=76867 RepID=A0A0C2Z9U8_HEBCY|nr:hypothetical protein M413DRAFT_439046 [Hebeloma cylindrosporum h7]
MPQTTREEVEITALIKGILNGYPGNSAILREYLQNSDDARASKQVFILDEQTHAAETILDPSLKEAQGPALIAYNDGVLRPDDWKALCTIHSSSKKTDEEQTGKNGLGFRASYHLTENPHVLSSQTLMVLDPHLAFVEHPGGISINVVEEGAMYKDQLTPFTSIMPGEISPFSGTAFRLPLRTSDQAARSRISDKATHVGELREILRGFVSNELESVILFLKHVTSIEVRRIDPLGKESILGKVEIDKLDATHDFGPEHRTITLRREDGTSTTRTWKEAASVISSRLEYDVEDRLALEKLTPGIDIAFPLTGPNAKGALFTLLPLPINIPGSSFHINATFALTPDRQNLKKKQEVGDLGSRERLLVEWNMVIMEEWAPAAWAKSLSELEPLNLLPRGWSAWPPEEHDPDSYWFRLAHEVTKKIVGCGESLFPSYDRRRLLSIDSKSVLFAQPTDNDCALFSILSCFDVHVVQPPPHIFGALKAIVANFQASVLSPLSLHTLLCHSVTHLPSKSFDVKAAHKVMDYLALTSSPPSLQLLSDLPWFSRTDGTFVSLNRAPANTQWIIPATEEEARLFTDDPHMLSWDCVSHDLRPHLLKPRTAEVLNVTPFNAELVSSFLSSRFSPLDSSCDELPDAHAARNVDWLLQFWTWVAQWPAREIFFRTQMGRVQHLHLLPTSHQSLRKMSSQVVIFQNVLQAVAEAWGTLGVHALHDSIPRDAVSVFKEKRFGLEKGTPGFVSLLIRSCIVDRQPLLDQHAFLHIRDSLASGLRFESEPELSIENQRKLLELRVFMVGHHPGERSILGSASGRRVFINLPDNYPLPRLDTDVVYIDMRDFSTATLIRLVDRNRLEILSEIDVLKLAIDNWDAQPVDLQDRFIKNIFDNRRYTSELRDRLESLNFVSVNQVDHRVPPRGLIHPHSPLAVLYEGEAGRLPTGPFPSSDYLLVMQSERFVDSSLNESIVWERIEYLSSGSSQGESISRKAVAFVELLNQFWKRPYRPLILRGRPMVWFPSNDLSLIAPNRCRDRHRGDHAHPYYYDLCLRVLDVTRVTSPGFRSALGWSEPIPPHILVEQLRETLTRNLPEKASRLIELLNYLGQRYSDVTSEVADDLRQVIDDQRWIPVVARSIESHALAASKHAVLSESGLGPPFRQVDPRLEHRFLIEMGCTQRPTFETLVEELAKCGTARTSSAKQILEEIAHHHPDFDRTLVVVPDLNGTPQPIDNVYFADMNLIDLTGEVSRKSPIHHNISRSLAAALGIPLASSLILGEDDDEDDQMSEDLVERIRGFLREYDAQYAMNEFLANADDARATEFIILHDSGDPRDRGNGRFIAPAFQTIRGSPSLVLYNNATLSEKDFKGLRHVGRGGKIGDSETHGRHGLGALSFYYFTDVVTVISRDTVLILDPSAKYLPPGPHGWRRTALTRKISDIARLYPDQFKPYHDLGFSPSSPNFDGTIFILPLTSSIAERSSDFQATLDLIKGSYRDLSKNAFFFTKLEKISALYLAAAKAPNPLWRLTATRNPIPSANNLSQCILGINRVEEEWLIATSNETRIPNCHDVTARGLKLQTQSAMKVQLAIRVTLKDTKEPQSYLFSTLRLPKSTSLPFHLHSRFAISSNRQSIVFDPADSFNNRDSKTSFNVWILEEIVPPLYLSALEYLLRSLSDSSSQRFDNKHWWLSGSSDEISAVVKTAFRKLLPEADNLLFKSAANEWLSFRDTVFSAIEPLHIRKVLQFLKAPKFVSSYRRSGITEMSGAKTVGTDFVKQVVLNHVKPTAFQIWFQLEGQDVVSYVRDILEYVVKDAPLVGLPAFTHSTEGEYIKFNQLPAAHISTMYISSHASHPALFPSSLFLARFYSKEVKESLQADPSISVVALSEKNVTTLIKAEISKFTSDEERNVWLDLLWDEYSSLPTTPDLIFLDDTSLKVVKTSSHNLSLPQCVPNGVIYDFATIKKEGLASIVAKLGIIVLHLDSKSVIGQYLLKRFTCKPIVNFLLCFQENYTSRFLVLTKVERQDLSKWLRRNIYLNISDWRSNDPGIRKSFLLDLPIWTVYRDQRIQRLSASGVAVLPQTFPAEHLISYLKPATSVASYSYGLIALLEYCKPGYSSLASFTCMSARDIMSAVSLPTTLEIPSDFDRLTPFLHSMFQLPIAELQLANIQLPVSDGTLRRVEGFLYDHTVNLFSQTLKYTQPPSFLHERFRDLSLASLRSLGMTHDVDLTSFRVCASEVQRLAGRPPRRGDVLSWPERQELLEMSRTCFNVYQGTLPRLLMTTRAHWASLDGIAFIRPKDVRRQGASYDWSTYVDGSLPTVLPPSRFVRPNLEPIAWTQRYLCFYEPAAELLAVNTTFGVPRAFEVVEHLKVLTTRIAQDHPKNGVLLSDIQATYKWLDEHSEEAGPFLLSAGNLNLFLNVNDPTTDEWTGQWEAAKSIMLNLHYDYGNLKTAKDFLLKYDKLLLAAGCSTMKIFNRDGREPAPGPSETDNQRLKEMLNEFRKSGELIDTVLVPTSSDDEYESDAEFGVDQDEQEQLQDGADGGGEPDTIDEVEYPVELCAHRVVLAAAIPYFRERAKGWKTDKVVDEIRFYGSAVVAKLLLDYVYTGDFDFSSTSSATMDEVGQLLRDFLRLMSIAEEWDIPKLKEKLEWNIIHKFDMIQRLPHLTDTLREEAERYNAAKLKEALDEFSKHNSPALNILQRN